MAKHQMHDVGHKVGERAVRIAANKSVSW